MIYVLPGCVLYLMGEGILMGSVVQFFKGVQPKCFLIIKNPTSNVFVKNKNILLSFNL